MSQVSLDPARTLKPSLSSTATREQSEPPSNNTSTQEPRDMTQYVKQSLLDAKVMHSLSPWITCGVYDIQVRRSYKEICYAKRMNNQRVYRRVGRCDWNYLGELKICFIFVRGLRERKDVK